VEIIVCWLQGFYVFEGNFVKGLCNILKELKIENYNEEGFERATFQCDDVLECLKATYGHASRNCIKRHQNMVDDQVPNLTRQFLPLISLSLKFLPLFLMHF
jgi:hypothetical protein